MKGTQKMGKIYFKADMENTTLNVIKEAHDCAEVANDLIRIQRTIAIGTDEDALHLDLELRRKYPVIDTMLQTTVFFAISP